MIRRMVTVMVLVVVGLVGVAAPDATDADFEGGGDDGT